MLTVIKKTDLKEIIAKIVIENNTDLWSCFKQKELIVDKEFIEMFEKYYSVWLQTSKLKEHKLDKKELTATNELVYFKIEYKEKDIVKLKDGRIGEIKKVYLVTSENDPNSATRVLDTDGKSMFYAQLYYDFELEDGGFSDPFTSNGIEYKLIKEN